MLVFISFLSCKEKKEAINNVSHIDIDLTKKDFYIDKPAFEYFSFIKLETNKECLLKDISKVLCYDNNIYILSLDEPTVFIFDKTGKFLSKIKMGQGPEEVLFVSDISINDEKLYVLDMFKTIKEYDLEGNFIQKKYTFDLNFFSFEFTSSGLLLFDNNMNKKSDYNIYFYSDSGERKTFLEKKEWMRNVVINTLNVTKDHYLTWPSSDTIYSIDMSRCELTPAYFIDFKGKGINAQKIEKPLSAYNISEDEDFAWWVQNFLLYDNSFFFSFKYHETYYVKSINDLTMIYSQLLKDIPSLKTPSVGYKDGELIFACQTYSLIDSRNSLGGTSPHDIYSEDMDETDNPILIFIPIRTQLKY